jgi:hypothetical protein
VSGRQSTNSVLLVRPAAFGFNAETAATNVFARAGEGDHTQALREFDAAVDRLDAAGVNVVILQDSPDRARPDAVFPNNWVSFHEDGTMVLYPMEAPSRRLERRPEALINLLALHGFDVRRCIDLSPHELNGHFLEGTGSLILDRRYRLAFANLSPRTHAQVIAEFDAQLGYTTFVFNAADPGGRPIYHTNVLMSLGTDFAVLCLAAVAPEQRVSLIEKIEATGRTIIDFDFAQLRRFGCNLFELRNSSGAPLIALSAAGKARLRPDQLRTLESFGELLAFEIPSIEQIGGGSIRCMITDIHLPRTQTST